MNRKVMTMALMAASGIPAAKFASAATITWTSSSISGASDVSTIGTYISAVDENPSGPLTVAGVPFLQGSFSSPTSNDVGYFSQDGTDTAPIVVSGSFDPSGKEYYSAGTPNPSTGDTSYDDILSYLGFENSETNLTVSLNDLSVGSTYLVQMFVRQQGGGGNGAAIAAGPTLSSSGSFATGTFTADSNTQSFTFTGPGGAAGIFDALQLREQPTPEPASASIAIFGTAAICVRRIRRAT
jgi:hypothetical protein